MGTARVTLQSLIRVAPLTLVTVARLTLFTLCGVALTAVPAFAQNRGVYPLGMSAVNSGLTPGPGFSYANQLLFYARSESKDANGNTIATGAQGVLMDMNSFTWVSGVSVFGARLSATATLPVAKNELTSDLQGRVSGGAGFADSYYLPFVLTWARERVSVKAMYGFLAPTGRFTAGASDNVGSGYWTHTISSGQTVRLTSDRRLTLNTFEMYEAHTTQEGTGIKPGGTFDFDYSLLRAFDVGSSGTLQVGMVGYEARQTSARTGPDLSVQAQTDRYAINAAGIGTIFSMRDKPWTIGARWFGEFANRSSYQGYSVQIAGTVTW